MATYIPAQSMEIISPLDRMERMQRMQRMLPMGADANTTPIIDPQQASFLDIFKGLINNAIETNEQVDRDTIDIMLGNVDDLATIQANREKAGIAIDVLVSVKNEVLSAYNSIINMQI